MTQSAYIEKRSEPRFTKAPLLSHLDIELTERCNSACQHCYINRPAEDSESKNRELSTEQWQEILRQAADLGTLSVRFTGGEPLLREDFIHLYTYARKLGLKVILFTNARRITPELANSFVRLPALQEIEITVYGMRPETYDAVACVHGAYTEFRQGVQILIDHHVPFVLKGALLPHNLEDVELLNAWADRIPWMKDRPRFAMYFDLRARRDSEARNRAIKCLRISPEQGVAFLARRSKDFYTEMQRFCSQFIGPAGETLFTCGAGKGGCVDAYGRFQPCMLLRDPSLTYDLCSGSLRDALVKFFPQLKEIKAINPQYLDRCARCFLRGLCEQCPAKSWMEHGTLDTPVEYLCEVAHAQARFLGLLKDGERAWEVQDWQKRLAVFENGVGQ